MYSEIVFISKIVDYARVLENKDCGFGPREIDLKDPGFLLVTRSSGYRTYALTECHSGRPNSDTGGEFPSAVDEPKFGQDRVSWREKTPVSDGRDEFATSVTVGF